MAKKRKTVLDRLRERVAEVAAQFGGLTLATLKSQDELIWDERIEACRDDPIKLREIEASRLEILRERDAAQARKIEELLEPVFNDYDLPRGMPNRTTYLAFYLADELGLLHRRLDGAPPKWKPPKCLMLVYRVREARRNIAAERGCDPAEVHLQAACKRVLNDYPDEYKLKASKQRVDCPSITITVKALAARFKTVEHLTDIVKEVEKLHDAAKTTTG